MTLEKYIVERFFAQCNSLSKECTRISWQFRIVKGKSTKRQSFLFIIPAVFMELPGNWVKINGNIDAIGVNINRIELLHQHPCFEDEIRQVC